MNKFTFKENFIFWFFNFLNIVININKKINQKIMKQISKCEQERIHENIYLSYKGKIVSNAILFLSKNYIGREVLEIGGGDGSFYIKFKIKYKNLKNLISIDLVPKSKFVKKGDCTSLRFRDEQFDTIFSLDVIKHLNDNILHECFKEVYRVLKPNGYFIINTMNNEDLNKYMFKCPECGKMFHLYGHCQVFTPYRIYKILEKYSFKVIQIKTIILSLLARSRFLTKIIYDFKIDKLLDLSHKDLFVIAQKKSN